MNINPLDIVFIVILAAAAIRCTFKGFVAELMSMAALILGIVAAIFFSKAGAMLIDTYIGYSSWNQIIAFLVIFILVYLITKLVEGIIRRLLDRINLERLDKALGFFLGLAEGLIVIVFIVYLLEVQPIFDTEQLLESSFVARIVLEVVPIAVPAFDRIQESTGV